MKNKKIFKNFWGFVFLFPPSIYSLFILSRRRKRSYSYTGGHAYASTNDIANRSTFSNTNANTNGITNCSTFIDTNGNTFTKSNAKTVDIGLRSGIRNCRAISSCVFSAGKEKEVIAK
jgi:hypothetical protein